MRRRIANWLHVWNCGCVCRCNCNCSYSYSYSCRYSCLHTHAHTLTLAHSQALQKINNNFVRYTRRSAYVNVTYLPTCVCVRVCECWLVLTCVREVRLKVYFISCFTLQPLWRGKRLIPTPRTQARPTPLPPPAGTFSFCYFYLLCFYLYSFYLLWQRSCFFFTPFNWANTAHW